MSTQREAAAGGVWQGVLPLKLDTGADRRELDRAKLLLASLRRFWRGSRPFDLHIVAVDNEAAEIDRELADRRSRVAVTVHRESDFFAKGSGFFAARGMYKQQLIKLSAPIKLGFAAFITFDADVVCLREFDETAFVYDGRLVSQWEERSLHAWWKNSMAALDIRGDRGEQGLGVTPNVLHARICEQVFRHLEMQAFEPIERLCALAEAAPQPVLVDHEEMPLAWSEYSLYTLAGAWSGELARLHVPPATVAQLGIRLQSDRCVWHAAQIDRLRPVSRDPAHFLVVQSWAGVPPEMVEERAGLRGLRGCGAATLLQRLYEVSPAAAWAEIETTAAALDARLRALAATVDGVRALFDGASKALTSPPPAIAAPARWTYDVRLPNLYFDNVFDAEVSPLGAKAWVKRHGVLSARLQLPRTVQYDFTIAVADFAAPECEASFRLIVDGEVLPWLATEGRVFSSIIQERHHVDGLTFEVSVDPEALPPDRDISFSFSRIDIVRRGAA